MTRKEFEQRVRDENLRMDSYCIELNEYIEEIHVMGCVKKDNKWIIYNTSERTGTAFIIKEFDNENDAFDKFYRLIKAQMSIENR